MVRVKGNFNRLKGNDLLWARPRTYAMCSGLEAIIRFLATSRCHSDRRMFPSPHQSLGKPSSIGQTAAHWKSQWWNSLLLSLPRNEDNWRLTNQRIQRIRSSSRRTNRWEQFPWQTRWENFKPVAPEQRTTTWIRREARSFPWLSRLCLRPGKSSCLPSLFSLSYSLAPLLLS